MICPIAPNRAPIARPLILLQSLFRRIAMQQRQPRAIRLKSGAEARDIDGYLLSRRDFRPTGPSRRPAALDLSSSGAPHGDMDIIRGNALKGVGAQAEKMVTDLKEIR
jgi:hypothetical protein